MPGGSLQLKIIGNEDYEFTVNPQISYFRIVYNKYRNFSKISCELPLFNEKRKTPFFENQIYKIKLPNNGDLVNNLFVKISLPKLYCDKNKFYIVKWINNLEFNLIKHVKISIGGRIIQEFDSEFLYIYYNSLLSSEKKDILNNLTNKYYYENNVYPLDKFSPDMSTNTISKFEKSHLLFNNFFSVIPIPVWFNKNPFPISFLKYMDINLEITLNSLDNLILYREKNVIEYEDINIIEGKFTKITDISVFNTIINEKNFNFYPEIILDYIFLDNEEKKYFRNNTHEYFIEKYNKQVISSINKDKIKVNYETFGATKDLFIVARRCDAYTRNQFFNFTNFDSLDIQNETDGQNFILHSVIKQYNLDYNNLNNVDEPEPEPETEPEPEPEPEISGQPEPEPEPEIPDKPTINIYVNGGINSYPFFRFYTDPQGNNEMTPLNTLYLNVNYNFYRLNNSNRHPFYLSNIGYEIISSSDISLSGDGTFNSGITADQVISLSFNTDTIENLYYYCTSHRHMISQFTILPFYSGNFTFSEPEPEPEIDIEIGYTHNITLLDYLYDFVNDKKNTEIYVSVSKYNHLYDTLVSNLSENDNLDSAIDLDTLKIYFDYENSIRLQYLYDIREKWPYRNINQIPIINNENVSTYQKDIIKSIEIKFNDMIREEKKDTKFYSLIESYGRYSNHENSILYYSFALEPKNIYPSGHCNFSHIRKIDLIFNLSIKKDQMYDILIYNRYYNILKLSSGNAELIYFK